MTISSRVFSPRATMFVYRRFQYVYMSWIRLFPMGLVQSALRLHRESQKHAALSSLSQPRTLRFSPQRNISYNHRSQSQPNIVKHQPLCIYGRTQASYIALLDQAYPRTVSSLRLRIHASISCRYFRADPAVHGLLPTEGGPSKR